MLVSVIITTYNSPNFLEQCLNSFLKQKDKEFEIIIADDGSTKDTKELITRYKNKLKIMHAWHNDDGFRAAKIRNEAVKISKGNYLVFIDGDCITFNDFIENHKRIAENGYFARGNRAMLSNAFSKKIIDEKTDINLISKTKLIKLRICKDLNRILPILRIFNYPLRKIKKTEWKGAKTCNLGIWRDDFINVNGYDESYVGWGREDSDLVVRLINSNVFRKEAIFATGVLHLKHAINSRENFSKNDKLLKDAINKKKTYIKNGYKK
tara:strand:- start:649 stop:1446 length:798 start_codon:yes stop_codon:yes gene_type:complete